MATYKEIQKFIKDKYPELRVAQTCWIADVKRQMGYDVKIAANRIDKNKKVKPCPSEMKPYIEEAIKSLGI